MATKLPATDIVIIGLGWTGSIIAESMTKAGDRARAVARHRDRLSPDLFAGRATLRSAA